jgi:hypothetical protein
MKQLFLSLGAMVLLGASACMEVGPPVNLGGGGNSSNRSDTTYVESAADVPQQRIALLEEFTGVRCVNCPRAHTTILNLQTANPGRIVPVGIHTGLFANPYTGRSDFRIAEGPSLENLLGGAQGYPSGAINRTKFAAENQIVISDQKWSNYIGNELQGTPEVNLSLTKELDLANGKVRVQARAKLNQAQAEAIHLTVYVVEDNIIDFQLTPTGVDSNYAHKHVLRQCITPYNGVNLAAPSLAANRVFENNYEITLNEAWNRANLSVVAFVHRIGTDKRVLQAAAIKLN